MRNLKKFLALVLAMMMTLSLMVSVNAADVTADFTDADSVTEEFQEGVDVLNGMKVFEGYTDGSFKPKNNITRAEVATIVYRLATGDWEGVQAHLYKDYQKFTDVNGDHWAAGYINYCANAEWIAGYGNGKFGPNDQVTGYQAAAMILRAVGYGKNGEFVGSGWQVQVANVTRSEYLLVNVDNTTYANTLNQAATRELVAEILFQAAQIPTVTWTMLGGYNKYTTSLTVAGQPRSYNPSLGYTNYGLDVVYGIVVDNQETSLNRNHTKLSVAVDSDNDWWSDSTALGYVYSRTGATNTNRIVRLDLATGLGDFGHAYKVWFNARSIWSGNETTSNRTVYAAYDKSTKSQIVFDNSSHGVNNNANTNNGDGVTPSLNTSLLSAGETNLGSIATGVGFKLNANKDAFRSASYSDFAARRDTIYESPQHMYALISNSSDNTLDVVISLNVEATKITAVNNNVTAKTITTAFYSKFLTLNGDIEKEDFLSTHTDASGTADVVVGGAKVSGVLAADPATMIIYQSKLTGNSDITFQDYVIGNAIMANATTIVSGGGTGTTNAVAYHTAKAMDKKSGTVVGAHVNATWSNTDPDYVTLSDGTKIEKSPLYMTVPYGGNNPAKTIIPQVGQGDPTNEIYEYAEYEFYLDNDGKYIGARKVSSSDFIYGTYVDYAQELSTSTFNYYMTGVDKDGKVITKQVKTATTKHNQGDTTAVKTTLNSVRIPIIGANTLPYRDTTNSGVNGIGEGIYGAFTITGDGDAVSATMLQQGAADNAWNDVFDGVVTIDKTASTLGAVDVDPATPENATNDIDNNLFFTENTKFILVEGFGTDTLKTEVYEGITKLLGNNREVRIDLTVTTGLTPAAGTPAGAADHFPDGFTWAAMTYMEKEKFIYEQSVSVPAEQATLVILPKAAVSFVGGGNLYYVGNQNPGLRNGTGTSATQFTMYDAQGNESIKWIAGDYRNGGDDAGIVYSQSDRFYELVETKDKAQDGQPVYELEGHAAVNATYAAAGASNEYYATNGIIDRYPTGSFSYTSATQAAGLYTALTYSTQNASIMGDGTNAKMYNVANAKVVNLAATGAATAGTRYPGISDLTTLNNSSYNLNNSVKVACVLDKDNPLIVTTIFVCYNQSDTAI